MERHTKARSEREKGKGESNVRETDRERENSIYFNEGV